MYDYSVYYQSIAKPFFAPPEWMFGLAWGIIYPLIAVAFVYFLYLLYRQRVSCVLLYILLANLIANVLFTPILLDVGSMNLAVLDLLVVVGTLMYFEYKIYSRSKIIFILLLPYLLWGVFATILQVSIIFLN